MWQLTPGEFGDIMTGLIEADRDRRLMQAFAACSMGGDPFKLIGEESPANPNVDEAWAEGSPEGLQAKRDRQFAEAQAALLEDQRELHRQYMPAGLRSTTEG